MRKTVRAGGVEVEYFVDGEGPGLVMVHGTGGSAESNWGHLVGRLSQNATVVRPNYSGSGQTHDTGSELSLEQLADQVVAAAKDCQQIPFNLVGFSLGASVAAVIAVRQSALVRSLILLAGFANARDPYLELEFTLWRDLIKNDRSSLARIVLLTGFSPTYLSTLSTTEVEATVSAIVSDNQWEGMERQVKLDLSFDIRENLKAITQPTLVIGCSYDAMVPNYHAKSLAEAIPDAKYAELSTGHLAPLDAPEAFCDLIEEFFHRGGQR